MLRDHAAGVTITCELVSEVGGFGGVSEKGRYRDAPG